MITYLISAMAVMCMLHGHEHAWLEHHVDTVQRVDLALGLSGGERTAHLVTCSAWQRGLHFDPRRRQGRNIAHQLAFELAVAEPHILVRGGERERFRQELDESVALRHHSVIVQAVLLDHRA